MLTLAEEFECHAGECRDMAGEAYDSVFRTACARLADAFEHRAEALHQADARNEDAWLKHAFATAYSLPHPQLFR